MKYPHLKSVCISLIFALTPLAAQEGFKHERLEKLWETPAVFKVAESARYDSERKVIYVSNAANTTNSKEGLGFISKLSQTGEVIASPWVSGLNSPKGLGLLGNRLFVADIDAIVEIDIAKGEIAHRYPVEKAKDLNDISVAADGTVYASDTTERFLFVLKDGKAEVFLEGDMVSRANGVYVDVERLIVGAHSRLLAIDRNTRVIAVLFEKTGYIDGLEMIGPGRFLISDWSGRVSLLESGKAQLTLLDTKLLKVNAADLGWIAADRIILVPTFANGRVVAYRLRD